MAYLVLTDEELAMMRYTCDLVFVEESPLHYLESEGRSPDDYERTYKKLVEEDIIDPSRFRLTDPALNRVAPVTECDARILSILSRGEARSESDFYLLDDIAVRYQSGSQGHAIGDDLDPEQLAEYFGRRFVPRKSTGDLLTMHLSPAAFVAWGWLLRRAQDHGDIVVTDEELTAFLVSLPDTSGSRPPSAAHLKMGNERPAEGMREKLVRQELLSQNVLHQEGDRYRLRPFARELARDFATGPRTTVVRYDFGPEQWLMRDLTLIPTDGGLLTMTATPDGTMTVSELDGDRLKRQLLRVVGPLADKSLAKPVRAFDELAFTDEEETDVSATQATRARTSSR